MFQGFLVSQTILFSHESLRNQTPWSLPRVNAGQTSAARGWKAVSSGGKLGCGAEGSGAEGP